MNQFFQNLKLSDFAAVIVSIPVFILFFFVFASEKAREYKERLKKEGRWPIADDES